MSAGNFTTSEGLRFLLLELAYCGPTAWRTSDEATALLVYAMEKYAGLAHKYGHEPYAAAVAAFEVMRMRSTRLAEDPWAVVTRAVELTLIYEARAEGLLCSTGQARKTAGLDYHDAERFADRENEIADYHPAFQFRDDVAHVDEPPGPPTDDEQTNAFFALDTVVTFFVELGWRRHEARLGIELIAACLGECGDPRTAYATLRRDARGPGWMDVDHTGWVTILRAVLGDPGADYAGTARGRGMLLRLCTGDGLIDLYEDRRLADAIRALAPGNRVATGLGERHV